MPILLALPASPSPLTHTPLASAADGFFSVYCNVFQDLHLQEKTAGAGDAHRPGFGSAGSELEAVTAFYAYWLSFSTCRSDSAFAKHDKWDLSEAPSPVMRRLMQQKNKAVRDKARKMFNDKVRDGSVVASGRRDDK